VTSAWFTAALFNALVDEAPETLAGLSQILVGGEALSPAHVQRAHELHPGVRLVNGYGPTENTTFTCCHVIGPEDLGAQRAIPIGRPIANTSVQILDRDGQPVPLGVPGELVAGGDGVALGYAGQPALTAERFRADTSSGLREGRLYSTGDRARWRPDGVIEFLGRFDDQVKIRGHRIEPGEVAACLREHGDVRQALVVPRRTSAGSMQLVAYVVPQRPGSADAQLQLLAAHAAQRLPAYMLPATIRLVQHLPLKPNGKLDLEALEQAPQQSAQPAHEAPLTPIEAEVLAVWRHALELPALGPDDDFFEFGGDSLLAIRMLVRVERELGTKIPVRALVEGRTVRRVTSMLAGSLRGSFPRGVVRVRKGERERPLFCLPGLRGVALQFGLLAAKFRTNRTVYVIELHELDLEPAVLESLVDTAAAIVERMRAVQPEGKFSIWGYSYGGNLAVEVARELLRQGQEVELVALLDAYAPGALRDPSGFGKVLKHVQILQRLRFKDAYDYLASRILRRLLFRGPAPLPPPPVPATDLERRLEETERRGLRAFHAHRPTPFEGRVVLVQATDLGDWVEIADPSGTCGWGAICTGGVEIIPIGCEHLQLFKEPHISELARLLDQLLESVHSA
jgi:thioesterase domain-containing protein/acyl carrier protein